MPGKELNPAYFFCSDDCIYFSQDKKTTMLLRQLIIPITSLFVLSACGGGSSSEGNDTYPSSYLQFYNGSSNSATTTLTLTDSDEVESTLGSAAFGDATALTTVDTETYDLAFTYTDNSGDVQTVLEDQVSMKTSQKTVLFMVDNYEAPKLLNLSFLRDDGLDDQFKVYFANLLAENKTMDLYISSSTEDFDDADFVATVGQNAFNEAVTFDIGSYILYLTDSGSKEVVLQSPVYSFSYETEYILALRDNAGPLKRKIALDVIGNTTTVYPLEDVNSNAQFRVYNSLNDLDPAQIYAGSTNGTPVFADVAADTLTSYVEIPHGDYRVTLTANEGSSQIPNGLLTLNQGQSKSLIFYRDENDQPTVMSVTDSATPQVYDFVFNVVNVIPDFENVSIYFVPPGKTMETTLYYISSINDATSASITLPLDSYRVLLVRKDLNNNKTLLAQTDEIEFIQGSSYLLVAEKDPDTETGYKISLQY